MADVKGDKDALLAAEKRIAELEAQVKEQAAETARATQGWDDTHTIQWTNRNMEEASQASAKKAGRKCMTEAEFQAQDRAWVDRGMPGPNDLQANRNRGQIREFDAATGKEIGADPALAPRTVAPGRVGQTVVETVPEL